MIQKLLSGVPLSFLFVWFAQGASDLPPHGIDSCPKIKAKAHQMGELRALITQNMISAPVPLDELIDLMHQMEKHGMATHGRPYPTTIDNCGYCIVLNTLMDIGKMAVKIVEPSSPPDITERALHLSQDLEKRTGELEDHCRWWHPMMDQVSSEDSQSL